MNGSIDQPASDGAAIISQPATFSGHFTASPSDGSGAVIHDVQVTITSAQGHPGASIDIPNTSGLAGGEGPSQTFTWAPSPGLQYNGEYTVRATATYHDVPPDSFGGQTAAVTRLFYLSVPPTTPDGLSAQVDSGARTVKLTWSANPEPDIYGYVIQRRDPSSGGYTDLAGIPPATTYTDTSTSTAASGQYSYAVTAVRRSGDGTCCVASDPSTPATVIVSGDPVPTRAPPSPATTATTASGQSQNGGAGTPNGPSQVPPGGTLAPAPPLPPPVRADTGDFAHLLAEARAPTVTTEPPEPDAGFNLRLPFKPRTSRQLVTIPGSAQLADGAAVGGGGSARRRLSYEYLAGALVLFMLAMHALYLKRQADQVSRLRTVDPSAGELPGSPPGGSSRVRRSSVRRSPRRAATPSSGASLKDGG